MPLHRRRVQMQGTGDSDSLGRGELGARVGEDVQGDSTDSSFGPGLPSPLPSRLGTGGSGSVMGLERPWVVVLGSDRKLGNRGVDVDKMGTRGDSPSPRLAGVGP